ncbi:hypothetical protein GQ457_01G011190 [Hibiscus cannabinus]
MGQNHEPDALSQVMGAEGKESGEEEEVTVNIHCSNNTKFTVRSSLESNVGSFKALLAQNCDIPTDQQRLIYIGRILKDDQTFQNYVVKKDISGLLYRYDFKRIDTSEGFKLLEIP